MAHSDSPRADRVQTAAKNRRRTSLKRKSRQASLKTIESRLSLLGYVRGKDWSEAQVKDLRQTEQDLAACLEKARACPAHSETETQWITRAQELEIQRFKLLGQIHGNRISNYQSDFI